MRAGLRVTAVGLPRRHVRLAGVGWALVAGGVGIEHEVATRLVVVVELLRVAALARLAVGVALIVDRRAVGLVVEVLVADERAEVDAAPVEVARKISSKAPKAASKVTKPGADRSAEAAAASFAATESAPPVDALSDAKPLPQEKPKAPRKVAAVKPTTAKAKQSSPGKSKQASGTAQVKRGRAKAANASVPTE